MKRYVIVTSASSWLRIRSRRLITMPLHISNGSSCCPYITKWLLVLRTFTSSGRCLKINSINWTLFSETFKQTFLAGNRLPICNLCSSKVLSALEIRVLCLTLSGTYLSNAKKRHTLLNGASRIQIKIGYNRIPDR